MIIANVLLALVLVLPNFVLYGSLAQSDSGRSSDSPGILAGDTNAGPVSGMVFSYIPPGSFLMGSPDSEVDRAANEGPRHTVEIAAFEMMTTEVTQGMWFEVMGTSIRECRDRVNPDLPLNGEGADFPMHYISWHDCQDFIIAVNELDRGGNTYRLPTEAEWEYACRAGTSTRYYWGIRSLPQTIDLYCWCGNNSGETTNPVALLNPNGWGLYDMSGNVYEWCEDAFHISYSGAPLDGSAWSDSTVSRCVVRGGSWRSEQKHCRSAFRHFFPRDRRNLSLGFRLVRSVE